MLSKTEDERSIKAELAYQQHLTVARSTYREIIRKQQLVKIGVTAAAVAGGAVGALGFGIVGLAAGAAVAGGCGLALGVENYHLRQTKPNKRCRRPRKKSVIQNVAFNLKMRPESTERYRF